MSMDREADVAHVRRQLRIIGILSAAHDAGLTPLPTLHLHTIAYFADALAPVWGLRILDAQLLKRRDGPLSPTFQKDVDGLVGRGVITPTSVRHVTDSDGTCRLDASYVLHDKFASPIVQAAESFAEQAQQLVFVREVVHAISGLGALGIREASASDAAYGDDVVDVGSFVDIAGTHTGANLTARVAMRIGQLMSSEVNLTSSEMVHLYVREVYNRVSRAA